MTNYYEHASTKEAVEMGSAGGTSLGGGSWINLQSNGKIHNQKCTFGFSADDDERVIPFGFEINEMDPEKIIWEAEELNCVVLGYRISKMARAEDKSGGWQRYGFFESRSFVDSDADFPVDRVSSSIQLLVLAYSPDLTVDNFKDYLMVIGTSAASGFAALTNSMTHRVGSPRDSSDVVLFRGKPADMEKRAQYFWEEVGEGILPNLFNFLDSEMAAFKEAFGKETVLGLGQHWVTLRASDKVIKVGSDKKRSFVSLPTIDTSVDESGTTLMEMNYPDEFPALAHRFVGGILDNTLDKFIRNEVGEWVSEWHKSGRIGGKPKAVTDGAGDKVVEVEDFIPF